MLTKELTSVRNFVGIVLTQLFRLIPVVSLISFVFDSSRFNLYSLAILKS